MSSLWGVLHSSVCKHKLSGGDGLLVAASIANADLATDESNVKAVLWDIALAEERNNQENEIAVMSIVHIIL